MADFSKKSPPLDGEVFAAVTLRQEDGKWLPCSVCLGRDHPVIRLRGPVRDGTTCVEVQLCTKCAATVTELARIPT